MKAELVNSFIQACEEVGLDYAFQDDMATNYYNNDKAVIIVNGDTLYNIRRSLNWMNIRENTNVTIMANSIDDIRTANVMCNLEQADQLMEKLGLSLTDKQREVLVKIDRSIQPLVPETGDYHNIFHKLSPEEYDKLTPEEKEEYDKHVKEEEKRHGLLPGIPAQITLY